MNLSIDPKLFASVFGLIFVAELPDKTAFATLVLAARKHPWAVFLGVCGAFVVQSLISVAFGTALSVLPRRPVQVAAALLFFGFAVAMWRREDHEDERVPGEQRREPFLTTVWTSFVVIFIAEWGDLTQLATATLAAKRREPFTIFLAATSALWSVTAIAVAIGHRIKGLVHPRVLNRIAAVAFAAVGIFLFFS